MARAFLKLKRRAFVTLLARYWRLKTQAMSELRCQHELQLAKRIVNEGYEVPQQHQVGVWRKVDAACTGVTVRSGADRRCNNAVHAWPSPATLVLLDGRRWPVLAACCAQVLPAWLQLPGRPRFRPMISPAEMQALLQHMVLETGITRLQRTVSLAGLWVLCTCCHAIKQSTVRRCPHMAVSASDHTLLVFD